MTPTPYDFFVFYLEAVHLAGKARTVTIDRVTVEQVFNPRINANVPSIVVHFKDARRSLKLNKTQAEALMELTGKEEFEAWTGTRVTLTPTETKNHKLTITISKP